MKTMTLGEMQDFVNDITNWPVKVLGVEGNSLSPYSGYSYTDTKGTATIEVSEEVQVGMDGTNSPKSFVRAFLLHELGHLSSEEVDEPHLNEYNAHMWAIRKAEEKGYGKILSTLREEIVSWKQLDDSEYFHKYIRASELYLEEHGYVV